MRGVIVAFAALAICSAFPPAHAATVKGGTPCKIHGKTVIQDGWKYTCVKRGTKLVWNSGVKVRAVTPSPTPMITADQPSATPTPTPAPSVTPTEAVATPTPVPTATPTATGNPAPGLSPTPAPPMAGDACRSLGVQLSNMQGVLECRYAQNGGLTYVQLGTSVTAPGFTSSPEQLAVCRIPDQRANKSLIEQAIAFPRTSAMWQPGLPATGTVNVAVIPIDFSDDAGKVDPQSIIEPLISKSDAWLRHFSNGKLAYKWQTSKTWIRASGPTRRYTWTHPGFPAGPGTPSTASQQATLTTTQIANELLAAADPQFDFTNLGIVLFVYPPDVTDIWDAMTSFTGVHTNEGNAGVQVNGTGAWLYQNKMPIWAWFMHENMHPHGLAGHAPFDGSPLSIMSDQAGMAHTLTSWDSLILDWQTENQFYCVSKDNIADNAVTLSPIDSDELGTKAIMVKLSEHEVLVIESRRYSTWSNGDPGWKGFPEGLAGVLTYIVDTKNEHSRVGWNSPFKQSEAYAYYANADTKRHGIFMWPEQPSMGLDLGLLLYQGESLTTHGVTVSVTSSSNYDTVTLRKAG